MRSLVHAVVWQRGATVRKVKSYLSRILRHFIIILKLSGVYVWAIKTCLTTLADRLCQSRLAKAISPKLTSAPFPSSSLV